MDLKKTGEFLAQLRHEQGLTQEQLGEKIGVTNKTISRWENGNYLPPAEMLMQLSKLYNVSINELLSGERLEEKDYKEKAEENLKTVISQSSFTVQERVEYFKKKWKKENLFVNIVTILLFVIVSIIASILWGFENVYPFSIVIGAGYSIVRYNRMMAFVEHWAYGTEKPDD